MTTITNAAQGNADAKFHPARNDSELPAIELAGVLVFAYLADDGTLRVTVDTQGADERPEWRYGVPMRVNVNSGTVFEGTDETGAYDPGIVRHNTEEAPAVVIRPGEPLHVFGAVDIITGPYGAAEKLAELDESDDDDI